MPSDIENLRTRRSEITAELAAGTIGGVSIRKPTYSADGKSVQWTEYRRSLYEELQQINDILASLEPPFELSSEAIG